jgi:hypothetical protein
MNNPFTHPSKAKFKSIQKDRFEKALHGNKFQDCNFNLCKLLRDKKNETSNLF